MTDVEIFSVGDELLRGVVADTNSTWMAKRIAARGASLRRIHTLPDDPDVVAGELRRAIGRAPGLVLTQGGLGPTDDDRTREAIAAATERALEPNAGAESIVARRYEELAAGGRVAAAALGESRLRMTRLPRGAIALDNEVGAAPGVLLRLEATAVVALPGVPSELAWIWEHSLAPHLDAVLGPGGWAEVTTTLEETDESRLAELLRGVAARHPDVYVKSRAKGFDEQDRIRVTLTASAEDDATAHRAVADAFGDLVRALGAIGVELRSRE